MKNEKCPSCGNTTFKKLFTTSDYSNTREEFTVTECMTCGLQQTLPHPAPEMMHRYYKAETYISHKEKSANIIDFIYRKARKFTLRWKLSVIQSITNHKTLLDFGCGAGDFLNHCLSKGYKANGYEPTQVAANISKSKTRIQIYTELDQIKEKYSIITLWHVLEHIQFLNETIEHIKSILDKDGTIFIAVPNHKSFDAKTYGKHWAAYDVPRHLWHFDRDTMKQLMTKHNLKIRRIIPMKLDPYYISLVSEQYKSPQLNAISRAARAIITAWKSNKNAKTTGEYSSLIYVVQAQ